MAQKPDEFIKSSDSKKSECTYSKEDIIDLLSNHSFIDFAKNIISDNNSTNSCGIVVLDAPKNQQPRILLGLENFDTLETEQYSYSIPEFIKILFGFIS